MKVSKLISIDSEIATLLSKEDNASSLINSLLVQYYEENSRDFDKKIAELKAKQREIRQKMKEFKQKQIKKQSETLKRIDFLERILKDPRQIPSKFVRDEYERLKKNV